MKLNKIIFLFALFSFFSCFSQNKNELETKKRQSIQQIEYTNKLLNEVNKNKKSTINKLVLISKKIENRNNLISQISNEISSLDQSLQNKYSKVDQLKNEEYQIKIEYSKIIYNNYKISKSNSKFMFLLSSADFNQLYKRLKYFQDYKEYRRKQIQQIHSIRSNISSEIQRIENIKNQKEVLAGKRKNEIYELENEKNKSNETIQELKKKEAELRKDLEQQKKIKQKLEAEIRKILEAEAKKIVNKPGYKETPENKLLSDNFGKNKGKLPWPLERGIITGEFGKHEHPVLKGVIINSNGIDISTGKGEKVRSIFNGVVTKILAIQGANYTIIIRHGSYLTVYQNIVNVTVTTGQIVRVKDILGDVFYSEEDNNSILHLEVWNELNKLNPKEWLSKNK